MFFELILAATDVVVPYPYESLNKIVCSAQVSKILLVVMAGEHRTQIRDDPSTRAMVSGNTPNQQHQTIILYENTVYLLRIQLDCSREWNSGANEYNCYLLYDVNVWIDLNDDGTFDSSENASPFRWPINSYTPKGVYDLQIYIPIIDERKTRSGPHRMQLVVTMTEQYRGKCANIDYRESRDYTVSIVSNTRKPGK